MLELDSHITLDDAAIKSKNLTERFSDEDLVRIGAAVYEGYQRDKFSRKRWEERNEAGMNLALQIAEPKAFPWQGCSNVAFPLVTIGAMQFHARAYPTIVSGTDIVKCRTIGPDTDGQKTERAERISTFMSWQCYEEDQAWEEQHDRGLLNLAIVGTNFIKTRFDAELGCSVSELVLAKDLVVDYWAKSIETAGRATQLVQLYRNDIWERAGRGVYRDVTEETWYASPTAPLANRQRSEQDHRQGVSQSEPDENTPFQGLEQHVLLDLDGDGYQEPYVIVIEETTQTVLRIVCAFDRPEDVERKKDGSIIRIRKTQYFTKYELIPSPDGGFYGIGFGTLLGPLNESVNSAINQLFDAGTMSVAAGGFLARGAKIRGGTYTFKPFEWNRVDSSGDDLRKSLFPLPVREPNTVLFQLLSLLIDYTNRVSGANDMMVGENPGQNTPAETSRAMVEQGSKIYSAIFKRVWRAMKEEFKKRYVLNAIYLPVSQQFGPNGETALREDFLGNPNTVAPAADPNIASEGQSLTQAQAVKQLADTTAGFDPEAVTRFVLKRLKVPDIDRLYPGLKKFPPGKSEKIQIQEMKVQLGMEQLKGQQAVEAQRLQMEYQQLQADIAQTEAEIQLKQMELQGDVEDRQMQRMNGMLSMMKDRALATKAQLDLVMKQLDLQTKEIEARQNQLEPMFRLHEVAARNRELDQEDERILNEKEQTRVKEIAAKKPAGGGK